MNLKPKLWCPGLEPAGSSSPRPVAYWSMLEGTGRVIRDIVGGNGETLNGVTWAVGPSGPVLLYDGVTGIVTSNAFVSEFPATFLAVVSLPDVTAGSDDGGVPYGVVSSHNNATTGYFLNTFGVGFVYVDGRLRPSAFRETGVDLSGTFPTENNREYTIVARHLAADLYDTWVDGVQIATTTISRSISNINTTSLGTVHSAGLPLRIPMNLSLAAIYNRVLSPSEIQNLNPYDLITPRTQRPLTASQVPEPPEPDAPRVTSFAWDVVADTVKELLPADVYRDEYTIQLQVQWWNGTNPVYLRFGKDAVDGESVRLGGIGDTVRVLGAKARLALSAVSAQASSGGIETHTSLEYRHTRNFPDWFQWQPKT